MGSILFYAPSGLKMTPRTGPYLSLCKALAHFTHSHTQTQLNAKKIPPKTFQVNCSYSDRNAVLMREIRGERPDGFELIGKLQWVKYLHFTTILSRKATQNAFKLNIFCNTAHSKNTLAGLMKRHNTQQVANWCQLVLYSYTLLYTCKTQKHKKITPFLSFNSTTLWQVTSLHTLINSVDKLLVKKNRLPQHCNTFQYFSEALEIETPGSTKCSTPKSSSLLLNIGTNYRASMRNKKKD